jgi:hypothetical protein
MNTNDETKAVILFILFIILSLIDILTRYRNCVSYTPSIIPEILLHRLLNVFMYFGWIFDNKVVLIFYVISLLLLIIHWISNNWKCVLTKYENAVCGFDEDERYDYLYRAFDEKTASILTVILKIIIFSFIIYKLFK